MQAKPLVIANPQANTEEVFDNMEKVFDKAMSRAKILSGIVLILVATELILFVGVGNAFLLQTRRYEST